MIHDEQNKPFDLNEAVQRGQQFLDSGQFEKAIEHYKTLLVVVPGSSLHLNMAYCLIYAGRHAEAQAHALAFLNHFPERPEGYYCMSAVKYALGEHKDSPAALLRAIRFDADPDVPGRLDTFLTSFPLPVMGCIDVAKGCLEMGRQAEASVLLRAGLRELDRIKSDIPNFSRVMNMAGRLQDVLLLLDEALKAAPDDPELQGYREAIAARLGGE